MQSNTNAAINMNICVLYLESQVSFHLFGKLFRLALAFLQRFLLGKEKTTGIIIIELD